MGETGSGVGGGAGGAAFGIFTQQRTFEVNAL
jgi:hypothetical protein